MDFLRGLRRYFFPTVDERLGEIAAALVILIAEDGDLQPATDLTTREP